MKRLLVLALGLTACTLDPGAPLDETELQVTVVGIAPAARQLEVTVRRGGVVVARHQPAADGADRLDVWFRTLPVGELVVTVLTDSDQLCERQVTNHTGPQQEVVDLAAACDGPTDAGATDAGATDAGGGMGGDPGMGGAGGDHEDHRGGEPENG